MIRLLKVLNRDFIETCSVSANLRSVLFMLFNPVGDELITGGVDGTTVSLLRDVYIHIYVTTNKLFFFFLTKLI